MDAPTVTASRMPKITGARSTVMFCLRDLNVIQAVASHITVIPWNS
jgi:hypothetical protein